MRIIKPLKGQAVTEYLLAAGLVIFACAGLSGFLQGIADGFLNFITLIFLIPIP
ncbi:MAG: hypothetical protein JXR81_00420 [Candidatus Goldbacteria bacterium]|nr:hypothetical protein [Candidatus Goldiibacteriota bacterium]